GLCLPLPSTLFPYTTLFRSVQVAFNAGGFLNALARKDVVDFTDADGIKACIFNIVDDRLLRRLQREVVPVGCTGVGALCPNERRSEEHTSELQSRFDLVCRL